MKKKSFFVAFLMVLEFGIAYAQVPKLDSLFTHTGVLLVNVKEVSQDLVKYTFPNENIINTISVNLLFKARYVSGRVQTFYKTPSQNPSAQPTNTEKQPPTITSELLRKIITQDCEAIQDAATCTVSSNCNFKILEYKQKGGNVYSIEVKSIGTFYDIILSLDYEIVFDKDGKVTFELQSVYCYK